MEKAITLNLLEPTKVKQAKLSELSKEYISCCDDTLEDISLLKFAHSLGSNFNRNILHHLTYKTYRAKYKLLPSQLVISARVTAWNRRKICDSISRVPIRFDNRSFSYVKSKRNNPLLKVAVNGKERMVLPIAQDGAFQRFQDYINEKWEFNSVLLLNNHKVQFILTKSFKEPISRDNVLGIDIGSRRLATVTIRSKEKVIKQLYLGRDVGVMQNKISIRRGKLKSYADKGSSKAGKYLSKLRHYQRNFVKTRSWQVAHEVVNLALKYGCNIHIENLKNCRATKQTSRNKGLRKKSNRMPYGQFFHALECLCEEKMILLKRVKASYTSQFCPRCRKACRLNRVEPYKVFKCVFCGYTLDADRNASDNVATNIGERKITIVKQLVSDQFSSISHPVNDGACPDELAVA